MAFLEVQAHELLLLPDHWQPRAWLGFNIPGLGVLLTLVVVVLTGMLGANIIYKF